MHDIAEERRRQKQEDRLAKQRVLDQIKADRDAKKRASERQPAAAETTPTKEPEKVEPPPARNYDECKIQVRKCLRKQILLDLEKWGYYWSTTIIS